MANNLKGLTIEIGGDTSKLSDALKNVNGDISTLQADLRTVNSALKLDPSNVEAVAVKQELLTKAVEATREKLNTLKEAQRQADEQIANGTEVDEAAYRSLRAEIVRAESSVADYERQLNDLGEAADDANDALDDMGEAAEDVEDAVDAAGDAAKKAADKFEEMADGISEGADRMSTGFTNITGAAGKIVTGVTAAFAAVSGAMLYASESTEEYRTAMAKLQVAFDDLGWASNRAKDTYNEFYGLLGDTNEAAEASALLAELATNQKSLSEWGTISAGVYAKFGDALPITSLIEASNETRKTGQLTGALADALNWAGVNEEQFQEKLDKCRTSQEREVLIRNTLNGIYQEAGTAYKETAADLIASNEAQARYTEAMAVFGEKAQPILTAVRNGFASLLEAASGLLTNVDMNAITAAIENAFSWFLNTAVPAIKEAVQWVIDHKDLILGMITAIGAGFLAWNVVQIVSGAIQAFTSFTSALKVAKTAFSALDLAMKMNVIGIVITAVAALVAGFIYLWNNCEGFRNFFIKMWEGIKTAFNATVEWFRTAIAKISQFFSDAWNKIKSIWSTSTIKSYFDAIWNTIKGIFSAVKAVLSGNFSDAWTAIKGVFAGWGDFFSGLWGKVKGAFSGAFSGMADIGRNIIEGMWNGINSMVDWIGDKISSFGENVLGGIKRFFGIKSPSTVMRDQVGRDLARGVGVGIEQNADEAMAPMDDLVSEMTGVNIDRNINNTFRGTSVNEFGGLSERLDAVLDYLSRYLPEVAENASQGLYLDGDTLVGALGGRFDAELARQYNKKGRGQ